MEYRYYGWQEDVPVESELLPAVHSQRDLYDALKRCWCAETCAPRLRPNWTPDNPSLGQCSISAFLAQDLMGGEVYGVPLEEGGVHCYNVVDGHVFDLASEQFGDRVLCYENNPVQSREAHFADADKYARYLLLWERLKEDRREGS